MDAPREHSEPPRLSPRNDDAASVPSAERLGFFGFAVALGALVFFWVPIAGIVLWAFGAVLSLAGTFKTPRGFAVSGLLVSLISAGFAVYFIGVPKLAGTHHSEKSFEVSETTKKSLVSAETPSSNVPAATPSESVVAQSDTASPIADEPAAPDVPAATGNAVADDDEFEDFGDDAEDVSETVPPLPIARFAEIANQSRTWPPRVRLTKARQITLWDARRKVIMGRMEVPARSVVEVLEVRPDGILRVLDCTEQDFLVPAADTDFARLFAEKNGN